MYLPSLPRSNAPIVIKLLQHASGGGTQTFINQFLQNLNFKILKGFPWKTK